MTDRSMQRRGRGARVAKPRPMASELDSRVSELDMIQSDPHLSVELAAADLSARLHSLLLTAKECRADLTQRDIANRLRVSEGRVSQVLSGSEDIKILTFARYLRAMGYELNVEAKSVEASAPPLVPHRSRSLHGTWSVVYGEWVSHRGQMSPKYTVVMEGTPLDAGPVGDHVLIGRVRNETIPMSQAQWQPIKELASHE